MNESLLNGTSGILLAIDKAKWKKGAMVEHYLMIRNGETRVYYVKDMSLGNTNFRSLEQTFIIFPSQNMKVFVSNIQTIAVNVRASKGVLSCC